MYRFVVLFKKNMIAKKAEAAMHAPIGTYWRTGNVWWRTRPQRRPRTRPRPRLKRRRMPTVKHTMGCGGWVSRATRVYMKRWILLFGPSPRPSHRSRPCPPTSAPRLTPSVSRLPSHALVSPNDRWSAVNLPDATSCATCFEATQWTPPPFLS